MATHDNWDERTEENFAAWLESRPAVIQEMGRKYPPGLIYRMETGHRCTIYSYAEDGTVTVSVIGKYNLVSFSRNVFGIDPATLVECEGPQPGEQVGDLSAEPVTRS